MRQNVFTKYHKSRKYRAHYREAADMLDIAIQISEARKQKKMTQSQLARKVGMPQSQIARIESGNSNVTVGTLAKIGDALNKKLQLASN
jgi:predicted transcriptional regulator